MKFVKLPALFLLLTAFTIAPKAILLEHKFKKDDVYEWKQSTRQSMKQSVPGAGEITTETHSQSVLIIRILEVTKTGVKAEVTIPQMKVDTKASYGNLSLDSEGDQNIPFNKVLKSIASTPVIAFINKTGAVEKLEGLDKIQANIGALGLDATTQATAKQIGDQFASESALKSNLEQSILQYPSGKINVGDTWQTSNMAPMSAPIRTDNTWKLTAIDGQVISLENDGVVVTSDSTKEFSVAGFRAKANMKGRTASRAKANAGNGMPTEIKGVSEMKGSFTLLAGGQIPEEMEIPTEIVTEVDYIVTKK